MSPIRPDTELAEPRYTAAELRVLSAAVKHGRSLVEADVDPADPLELLDWPSGLELVAAAAQLDPSAYPDVQDLDGHPTDLASLARTQLRSVGALEALVEATERIAAVLERQGGLIVAARQTGRS